MDPSNKRKAKPLKWAWLLAVPAVLVLLVLLAARDARLRSHEVLTSVRGALQAFQARRALRAVEPPYEPRTGDLCMIQFAKDGLVGLHTIEYSPSHAGMIWVHPTLGPVVLEATVFTAPPLPNVLHETRHRVRGVRAVPLHVYREKVDSFLVVRPLIKGSIDGAAMLAQVNTFMARVDFTRFMADAMGMDSHVTLVVGDIYPGLGRLCARTSGLAKVEQRRDDVFCSEFVFRLLQNLGHMPAEFTETWRVLPYMLSSHRGFFDAQSARAPSPLAWGPERVLECRRGLGGATARRRGLIGLAHMVRKGRHPDDDEE